ncbi:MAG: hypothetical protein HY661_04805 [Betaproteobacteria bacterium]|nr:hypothetical protein [Betaproteobacteria bacterium]
MLAALIGYMVLAPDEVPLDPRTLCPRDAMHNAARTTAVVIDRTDPITEVQQEDALAHLTDIFRKAMPRERFVIYGLDARSDIVLNGTVRCNPLGPKQGSALERLNTDTEFDEKLFNDKFLTPLVTTVKAMLPTTSTSQTDSPIMELVQAVAVRDLKRSPKARLVLVSDLMQHSARYSHYKVVPNFKEFGRSDAFREVAVDLSTTAVHILYVTRSRGAGQQPPNLEDFWQQYFSALRANSIVIEKIRGEGWK